MDLTKMFESAFAQFDAGRLVQCGLVILAAIILFIIIRIAYLKAKKKIEALDDIRRMNTLATIYRIAKIVLIFVTVLVLLQVCGINVSSLILGFGFATTIVALAVKDVLQDIFAGVMIRTDKFFKVGDAVEFEGKDGIVISFSIRSTKIEFLDDRSVMSVANRNISKIRSLTHLVDIDVPLSYDQQREDVFAVLEGICEEIRGIEGVEDCMLKGTQRFGESAVIYKIRFFCEPNDRPDIRREAHKRIQDGLAAAGISIPYRQIDIHNK